jgi:hypothetical protein
MFFEPQDLQALKIGEELPGFSKSPLLTFDAVFVSHVYS